MRKFFGAVSLLFFAVLASSQILIQPRKYFLPAEILLENGETKTGLVKQFENTMFHDNGIPLGIGNIEGQLNLDVDKLRFKATENAAEETIPVEQVKSVVFMETHDGKTIEERFDKAKLKSVNNRNEIVDLHKTVMLPFLKGGKVNIYGLFLGSAAITPTSFFIPYLKKDNEPYAYLLIDFNKMSIFSLGKLEDKFRTVFMEIAKDCPAAQQKINLAVDELKVKPNAARREKINKMREEIKNVTQMITNPEMQQAVIQQININFHVDMLRNCWIFTKTARKHGFNLAA